MQSRQDGGPCMPPSAKEKRLLELLEQAPANRFTAILKCVPGWQFEGQANLYNWRNVLDKLKTSLTSAVEQCPRLVLANTASMLTGADVPMASDDEVQWTEQAYETLRFSAVLLENAVHKHVYNAVEIVTTLIGARNDRVAFEATRVITMLALPPQQHRHAVDPNNIHMDNPATGNATLRRRLRNIVDGLATSTSDLGEISWQAGQEDEFLSEGVESLTIFEFTRRLESASSDGKVSVAVGRRVIESLKVTTSSPPDLLAPAAFSAGNICDELIAQYDVPSEHRFALLTKVRALAVSLSSQSRKEVAWIERLHALTALLYVFSDSVEVASLIEKNPGLSRSLVELIRVEKSEEVPLRVRIGALQVLSALVYDRADRAGTGGVLGRHSNVLQALGVAKGAPHGVFPSLARFALSELGQLTSRRSSRQPSSGSAEISSPTISSDMEAESDMDMSVAVAFVQATTDFLSPQDAQVLRAGLFRDPMLSQFNELCWIEAVLVLLNTVVSMQSSAAILTESGVVPALLHVASSPSSGGFQSSLITLCVQALETMVNSHPAAAALYRELSGVNIIVDRLHLEISIVGSAPSLSESKVVLITALLAMLSVSFHSQGVMSAGATSRVIREGSVLSKTLTKILRNIDVFGPAVFAQASIVVSDIVNNDPSSVNQVHSGGIAEAFLKTITRWNVSDLRPENLLPPSSELIMAIPSVLTALCLTSNHADKVARSKPLLYLMDLFASPALATEECDYLQGDVAPIVGSAVFEMMRQVPAFQSAAIQACVEAAKKIVRFGEAVRNDETPEKDANYKTLLRMAAHFTEVVEPIVSKSDHASAFSEQQGVSNLLTIYQLILPGASTFLSSLLVTKNGKPTSQTLAHQPAAQSITQTLRAFASHQPLRMLSAIMSELSKQVRQLRQPSDSAPIEGLFTSLPEVDFTELIGQNGARSKVSDVSEYLRRLAYVEWLVGQLAWTMQIGQSSLQNRTWFSELQSRSNASTLEKLFGVCRSVQLERAKLVAQHRSSGTTAVLESASASSEPSPAKITGLWKLCSLLLLRFNLVTRNLLVAMCKTFVFIPGMRTRGDDSGNMLAHHAQALAQFVATCLTEHVQFVVSSQAPTMDPFARKYFLVFVLETTMQCIFDAKTKQTNALLLSKLFKSPETASSALHVLISSLLDDQDSVDATDERLQGACFKACAGALQHLADVETLRTSQVTTSLIASAEGSSGEGTQSFDLRKLILQIHRLCVAFVLRLWQSPRLQQMPLDAYAQELLPAVVMLLRHRVDSDSQSDSTSRPGGAARRPQDQLLERFGRGLYGDFPGAPGGVLDRDDFLQALFGATGRPSSQRLSRSRAFEVDSATVDSLVAMGFPRARVERAIRRVRVNSVELAMEWLLSHPDDDEDDDEAVEDEADGDTNEVSDVQTDSAAAPDTTPSNSQSDEEKELIEGYTSLRATFEDGCFSILREQVSRSPPVSASPQRNAVDSVQSFVTALAQYLALLCSRVNEERQTVIGRVWSALLAAMDKVDGDERYVMAMAHLLAAILHLDATAVDVLTSSFPSAIDSVVKYIHTSVSSSSKDNVSCAALLLVLDAVQSSDARPVQSVPSGSDTTNETTQPKISSVLRHDIVRASVKLMGLPDLQRSTAHSIWQLLSRLTLDYSTASELFSAGGIDRLLNLPPAAMFPGYTELTAVLLVHMLESPQVLQQLMEDKIQGAMTKLTERYGPPSQTRITPRVLMAEVATIAARNERVFMQALQKAVVFKKTESGRTYVIPRTPVDRENVTAAAGSQHGDTGNTAPHHNEKKSPVHKAPKSHRHHAQTIVNQLVGKIQELWKVERVMSETKSTSEDAEESSDELEVGVGTYLYLLVQVVASFPACAAVITKSTTLPSTATSESAHCIISLALREFLPCKALCHFAAIRRSLELNDDGEDLSKRSRAPLTRRTRDRVKNAHKLLVALGTQPGDGPKVIVSELVKLFQEWPTCVSGQSSEADLTVDDEGALSALHAWSALVMSILWPRGGAAKSFSWDKIVLGGGLSGKYAFVTLLVEALRKIKLSHPFAHATCSMVLRPLTTLTRPFVTHRVKKLLKKRATPASAEAVGESTHNRDHESPGASGAIDHSHVSGATHGADGDVAMESPQSVVDHDHEMRDVDEDAGSEDSSLSEHSLDHHDGSHRNSHEHEDYEEDEEGDEDDEDDDDEDEDDDEEDEEDDEEEDEDEDMDSEESRIRLRISRRHHESERSRSGRGVFDTEGGEAFDEANEEEFSLQRLLEDESVVSEQARESQLRAGRSRTSNPRAASSVVDLLGLDNAGVSSRGDAQTGVFTFGDDDDDEDDPDMAFRHRDHGFGVAQAPTNELRSMGGALASLLADPGAGPGSPDDFIFETIGAGDQSSPVVRAASSDRTSTTHPLLQFASVGADPSPSRGGSGLPDRLPLPRHTPSLFNELNALVRHMNSNLHMGGSGGARTLLGRDLLRPMGGGGRHRPPTRNRLSTVSSWLNEFSLELPTGVAGMIHRGRPFPGLLQRDRHDLSGRPADNRGDPSAGLLWGTQGAADIRSVAARLEQLANDLIEDEPPAPPASTAAASEETASTQRPDIAQATLQVETDTPNVNLNDSASETASVIALASTLDESSLRSPQDDAGSESEVVTSPVLSVPSTSAATTATAPVVVPPPAPVTAATNVVFDLSSFQLPIDAPVAPPSSNEVVEEEMKSADEDEGSSGLVCPEGVDPEVFAFLPPDMQAEIVAQHAPPAATSQSATTVPSGSSGMSQLELDMANSSIDRDTLEALPEDIRAEVLANERREREALARAAAAPEADVSRAEEMDNASFVASLTPELREEILTTCDDAFLQTLSSQVQAEAMVLRERAAYRPIFREAENDRRARRAGAGAGADDEGADDIFRRPTLRRMLTSHGGDVFAAAPSRRTGRGRPGAESAPRSAREESAKAGLVRVLRDEEETDDDRILEDKSVRALLRLLFLGQHAVPNRVFQRLLVNVCTYPKTRDCVRAQLLRIVSAPLANPLKIDHHGADDDFPMNHLYGSHSLLASTTSGGLPSVVLSRVLAMLVALARHNVRFAVDCLRYHGLLRQVHGKSGESGAEVLIELLGAASVVRSSSTLDTLLELIELVLTPLDRLAKSKTDDEEEKKEDDDELTPATLDGEWVRVPLVTVEAARMEDIVSVLSLNTCTPSMQDRTIQILKLLNRVPGNRPRIMHALVQQAKQLTTKDKFRSRDVAGTGFEASAVLKSAQDELKLLRLLHTLSDVCETTADFEDCCGQIALDEMWVALSESLDEARVHASATGTEARAAGAAADSSNTASTDDEQAEGTVIEGKSAGASVAMAALLARFLPMVEAFFVVSARDAASMPLSVPDSAEREEAVVTALREGGLESQDEAKIALKRLASTSSEAGGEHASIRLLAEFVEANRVLLNLLVREKPSLLDSSLAALVKLPRCRAYLDFDNKRTYFQSAMKKLRSTALRSQVGSAAVRLTVRRDHIFEDSYYALRMRSGAELRRKLHISFTNEEGIDAGGVTREWYVILAREIFNPNYVLFTSAADSPTFQPNPLSYVNKDHLSYFEFVGKVIGKAVADGQLLDAHFTRSFYKHILQLPISYHDMEAIDPEYYRNLHSILDNNIEDLGLELTFSAEQSNFGRMEIVDLIPSGRNIAVTNDNKMEYVKLVTHHRMATGIRQQIDSFLKGFHQLVPPEMISIFNENELELLISGMPEIDIDDLKANTDYSNYKPTDNVIRWFWNVLYSCTHEERALFLQFVTGTSKVPLEGFKALEGMRGTHKFNIHKAFGNPNALPSAHTCFNQLDLPEYESEEKLRQCLLLAIREGTEGFGFG